MSQKKHTAEQIISKLREAEVELAKGATEAQVCKKIGVSDHTYYRWRSAISARLSTTPSSRNSRNS